MLHYSRLFTLCLVVAFVGQGRGQSPVSPSVRHRTVPFAPDIVLDTLTVLPHTVSVRDTNGRVVDCSYEIADNRLVFEDSACLDSGSYLTISYRVLPFHLGKRFKYIDTTTLTSASTRDNYIYDYKVDPVAEGGIFGTKGVQYTGSFSRGLSIGNNQDLIYDAEFNMAMEGDIGEGIHIKGAIADNKLPIQPEGNTKQLSAFDRVFIELSRGPYRLLAGDYDSRSGPGRFLKYNRKLLGLSFHSDTESNNGAKGESKVEFAISKGKFRRQQLQVQEGNQGPYKLTGNQGERFIVVISGSERVYYDGVPLQRGEDADYIMNYNLGEVAFTIRRPITINSRIIVEFEYLNQQYSRSIVTGATRWTKGNTEVFVEGYNRTDSRTPSVNFQGSFDSAAIALLQQVPEKDGELFLSGIRPVEATAGESRVLYELRDTFYTVEGIRQDTQVLVYDQGRGQGQKYTASFSEVGPAKGDYVILRSAANGRIYKWVAPDAMTGMPRGEYTPALRLVPPSAHQVVELGVRQEWSKNFSTSAEASWSHLDLNRYSTMYEDNDNGVALYTDMKWLYPLGQRWKLQTTAGYEYKSKNYAVVDPYRAVEFNRYWNLVVAPDSSYSDHQPQIEVTLIRDTRRRMAYQWKALIRPNTYRGDRQTWEGKWTLGRWNFSTRGGIMNARDSQQDSRYFTPRGHIEYRADKWSAGVYYTGEDNRKKDLQADTLNNGSFYFHQMEGVVRIGGGRRNELRYIRRIDGLAVANAMHRSTLSDQLSVRMAGGKTTRARWSLEGGARRLDVEEQYIRNTADQNTILGKVNLQSNLWKEAIQYSGVYEVNAGQEPKLEFVFVEVRPGEGQYIYTDYNNDGIHQVNEYVLAPFADTARYVKLRAFNNNFIQTNSTILQQNLSFNPSRLSRSVWTNWNMRSIYRLDQKAMSSETGLRLNPLTDIPDSALVRFSRAWSSRWIYNPGGSRYDLVVGYRQTGQRMVLVTGYEQVNTSEWTAKWRWNLLRSLDMNMEFRRGNRSADSESFEDRVYAVVYSEGEMRWSYLPSPKLKLSALTSGSTKQNNSSLMEQAQQLSAALEGVYRKSAHQSFRLRVQYVSVSYTGMSGTSLELVMLEGLRKGNNYLWECQWDRKLTGNVYLKLNYNGRKTGSARVVHTGTLQMKALF